MKRIGEIVFLRCDGSCRPRAPQGEESFEAIRAAAQSLPATMT
jgi:hypothetical protein